MCRRHHNNRSSHRDRPGGSHSSHSNHSSHRDRLGDSRSTPLCREVAGRIPTVSKIGSMLMEQRLKEEAYLMRDLRERVVA